MPPFTFNLILCCVSYFLLFCPSTSQGPHFKFFCAKFFLLPNCFRIKSSTHLIQFPWQYEFATLKIITLVPFDTIPHILTAYSIFQVSHDPLSSNDTGHHAVWILITLDSWLLIPGRCNLILGCCDQNPYGFY